jgi:hypothetical protein
VSWISGHRSGRLLYPCLLAAGVLSVTFLLRISVLRIGSGGPFVPVSEGDVISLRYTHSMYGVPVEERLRVEDCRLALFHVVTSDAALEYYGIERRGEGNARRVVDRFNIPRDSVGGQTLTVRNRRIVLRDLPGQGNVTIGLERVPILLYWVYGIWR